MPTIVKQGNIQLVSLQNCTDTPCPLPRVAAAINLLRLCREWAGGWGGVTTGGWTTTTIPVMPQIATFHCWSTNRRRFKDISSDNGGFIAYRNAISPIQTKTARVQAVDSPRTTWPRATSSECPAVPVLINSNHVSLVQACHTALFHSPVKASREKHKPDRECYILTTA